MLADYVRSFVPDAHALATDDQAALQAVAGPFGVSYEVTTSPDRRGAGRPLQLPVRRRRRRQAGAHVAGGREPRDHDVGQGPRRRHGAAAARRRRRRCLRAMIRRSDARRGGGRRAAPRWRPPASPSPTRPDRPTTARRSRRSRRRSPGIDGRDRRRRLVPAPRRRAGQRGRRHRLRPGAVPATSTRRRRHGEPALAGDLPQRLALRRRRRRPAPTRRCRPTGRSSPRAARTRGTTTAPTG